MSGAEAETKVEAKVTWDEAYNFAYLDEQTKRMIRRTILKAVAVPGYQVPFGGREMPLAYGWGTGGIQVTASVIGPQDTLKVIDQGADDTTNAVSIRRFFERVAGVETTEATEEADIIQTRHRIPEAPLREGQVLVYQVPQPEPLRRLEPRETETRKMHGYAEYGLMHVRLYEDISRFGHIATTYGYPVMVNGRYLMSPSPIPKFDNPKMAHNPALQLFGAGREKRIYAIPPYTEVKSLDFEDHPFSVQTWSDACALCGARDSYLDEVVIDDRGGKMFVCSDTHFCADRRAEGHVGALGAPDQEKATMSAMVVSEHGPTGAPPAAAGLQCSASPMATSSAAVTCPSHSIPAKSSGIVGEFGSGKSTLLNVLSAQLTPEAGQGRIRSHEQRDERYLRAFRTRAAATDAHRLGYRPPEPARWPAHGRLGRRQCRRTADGHRPAPLRQYPCREASIGWPRSSSMHRASITCPRPFRAACSSVCRSRATWSPARGWCSWTSPPAASTSRCRRGCSICCAVSCVN